MKLQQTIAFGYLVHQTQHTISKTACPASVQRFDLMTLKVPFQHYSFLIL